MRELSLHILDIVENGLAAGADCIHITVDEARRADRLTITIADNGRGIPAEKLEKLTDPFFTTRTNRKVGLGLPLLAAAAERREGKLEVSSKAGEGTRVRTGFRYSHIDRAPLGDMTATITTLITGNPGIDFVYRHVIDGRQFTVDTRELKKQLGQNSLRDTVFIHHLSRKIRSSLKQLAIENGKIEPMEENHAQTDD